MFSDDNEYYVNLREKMEARFNDSELEILAFDLGIDTENIKGQEKRIKIIEIIKLVKRYEILHILILHLEKRRPTENWHDHKNKYSINLNKSINNIPKGCTITISLLSLLIVSGLGLITGRFLSPLKPIVETPTSIPSTSIPISVTVIQKPTLTFTPMATATFTPMATATSVSSGECGKPYNSSVGTNLPILEGFENTDNKRFKLRNKWEIILDQQNNYIFAHKDDGVRDFSTFTLDNISLDNFEIEFCYKVIDYVDKEPTGGEIFIHFRENTNNTYRALLARSYFTFQHYGGTNWSDLNKDISKFTLSKNVWYKVKIIVNGSKFEFYIDNKLIDSAEDVKVKDGSLKFGVGAFTTVYFDNIKITAIK